MNNGPGAPSLVPKIFRFSDIDTFRSSIRALSVDFTPLVHKIFAEQIILNLPGCDVNYTKSFPRICDAQLDPNCTAVGFSMDDGVPIRFNGIERDRSVIVLGRSGAACSLVERTPRQYASIIFTPEVADRGWPESGPNFKMFETSIAAQDRLRMLVHQVLAVLPQFVDAFEINEVQLAIRETLLAAVDAAFADVVAANWTARANSLRQFRIFANVQEVLSGNERYPIYSDELARQVGASVRTLHDAVKRYRGMSLHRYLRLRRLWLVRKRLLSDGESVKACALAFGFWHLSDFSRIYRQQFGEAPSETLARSRQA